MLEFKEISLDMKDNVEYYLDKSKYMGCEYNFTNLFIWRKKNKTYVAEKDGFLYINSIINGNCYFLYPAGDGDIIKGINNIIEHKSCSSGKYVISGITADIKESIEALMPGKFEFKSNRDWSDYIYNTDDLINLTGSKFHAKRNHINKFEMSFGTNCFEDITDENIGECMDTYLKWVREHEGTELSDECSAVTEAMSNFKALGLIGGLIRVNGNVCAFTAGSRINDETFDIHIEKGLSECPGSYAVINRDFARKNLSGYKYINREEDMGIEGLRKAKLSYQPAFVLEKFTAVLKNN